MLLQISNHLLTESNAFSNAKVPPGRIEGFSSSPGNPEMGGKAVSIDTDLSEDVHDFVQSDNYNERNRGDYSVANDALFIAAFVF
jgi:hypothetical protein